MNEPTRASPPSPPALSRRFGLLAVVLVIFIALVALSERAGDYVDHYSSGDADGSSSSSSSSSAASFGGETMSPTQRIEKPPPTQGRKAMRSDSTTNEQLAESATANNKKQGNKKPTLPLPDFHLGGDVPDANFARLKALFQMVPTKKAGELGAGKIAYPAPLPVHYIRQIHHGIYECRANLESSDSDPVNSHVTMTVSFAFKTECRPAAKWHGQQGYPEILVNWMVESLFGPSFIGAFTPGAVGGFILLPAKLVDVIHRDGCGFLTEEQISTMFPTKNNKKTDDRILIGAVLQWKPRHNDDALPGQGILKPFRVHRGSSLPPLPANSPGLRNVLQISDIFVLDYIAGNEDRLEKNWFKDEHGRFIAMDNGWALAGFNYAGSVCDVDESNLKCPPLFRKLVGKKCVNDGEVANCRFRAATVNSVRKQLVPLLESEHFAAHSPDELGGEESISHRFARDPLLVFLSQFYGGVSKKVGGSSNKKSSAKSRIWSDALARFVDGCGVAASSASASVSPAGSLATVSTMVRKGLLMRAKRFLAHVTECEDRFGADSVLF